MPIQIVNNNFIPNSPTLEPATQISFTNLSYLFFLSFGTGDQSYDLVFARLCH